MGYRTIKYMKMDLPDGFKRVDKKTVQSRMSPLLKELMEIAKKEGIKIYLVFGNLLGYERHNKSFIPWDDDIDVAVSYWDRDRLARAIEKSKKLKTGYFGTKETREWPGLYLSNKKFDVICSGYFEEGVLSEYSIDVFEYANFKRKNDHKKIKRILGYIFMKNSTGGGLQKLVRMLLLPFPKKFFVRLLHKRENKLIVKNGEYEWVIIDDVKDSWKTTFDDSSKKGLFNNIPVYLPNNSEIFLESRYGDWEKIPDEKSINWNTHYFGERKK